MFQINRRRESVTRKVVRLIGTIIAVQILILCFAVRASYTQTNEAIMSLGAQMLRFSDALHQDRPRRIQLNGLTLHFTSGSTLQPVNRVLDTVHTKCREMNGNLAEQLDRLIKKGRNAFDRKRYSLVDGVIRYGNEKKGFVACLASRGESSIPDDMVNRIRRFLGTGDLSQIGELRYVMAERRQKTSFVAFWTEGSANLFALFPHNGDAPGHDLPGIPRPRDSRRALSAWENGTKLAMAVYVVPHSILSVVIQTYRRQLAQNGWRILNRQPTRTLPEQTAFIAEKAGTTAHFEFSHHFHQGTAVTMLKMN